MHFTEWSPRYFTYLALDIVTVSTSLGPVSLPQCSSPRVCMHVGTYGDDSLSLPPRLLTEPRGPTSLEVFVCPTPSRHNENRKQQWSERPRGGSLGCSTTWDGCFLLLQKPSALPIEKGGTECCGTNLQFVFYNQVFNQCDTRSFKTSNTWLCSLRLPNKKLTTANTTTVAWCECPQIYRPCNRAASYSPRCMITLYLPG